MGYFIIIIALFCGYKIYSNQGQKRFDWFVCSMMVMSSAIIVINKPQIPCHRLFLFCYWLSVLKHNERQGVKFPLAIPLSIYIVGLLIVSSNSPYLNIFYKIYKPFVFLIDTYLILLLACYGIKQENFKSKAIVYTLMFVTFYGVVTLILSSNPIQNITSSAFGQKLLQDYYFGDRVRITSTWSHPIAYGLICGALFYEYLPYWKKKKIQILMLLLAINVFLCGSRTALAAFFLMGGVIVLTRYKLSRAIRQGIIVCIMVVPIYCAVPMVQNKIDSMVNTALGNEDVAGSSLEMRDEQTYYAMLIVSECPLLGHGLDYIMEVMGYGTDNFTGDSHLLGLESYTYILLIERGFIGLFLEIFIWASIIFYALRYRKQDVEDASLIIAYILGFAFFSISTGTLDTKIPMLFMVSVALSKLSNSKKLLPKNRLLYSE